MGIWYTVFWYFFVSDDGSLQRVIHKTIIDDLRACKLWTLGMPITLFSVSLMSGMEI